MAAGWMFMLLSTPEDVGKITKQLLGSSPQLGNDNLSTADGNEAEKNSS